MIALMLSGGGILVDVIVLRNAGLDVLIWHIFPYVCSFVLFYILNSKSIVCGTLLMLFIDLWLFTEGLIGTKSKLLMLFSVLSAFKIIILFPLGIALGYLFCREQRGKLGKIEGK